MATFDIHRIFEQGYPGLKVAARIGSAADYQSIVERYLPVMRDQLTVQFQARMKREYPTFREDDLSEEYESHHWTVDGLLAGFLSGSVLVTAWAAFEQSITAICKYVQAREKVPLAFEDLREQDLCKKLQQYLRVLTRQECQVPHSLSDIQAMRNLFAHHNGNLEDFSEKRRNQIMAVVKSDIGVSVYDKHQVVLSQDYLRRCVQNIDEYLTTIVQFIETHYPYVDNSGRR